MCRLMLIEKHYHHHSNTFGNDTAELFNELPAEIRKAKTATELSTHAACENSYISEKRRILLVITMDWIFIAFSKSVDWQKMAAGLTMLILVVTSLSSHVTAMDILGNVTSKYDKRLRPSTMGSADSVYVQLGIVSLGPLDAKSFTFELDMYLRHSWNDPRLRFHGNHSYNYNGNPAELIWVPDTYFENAKKTHLHKVMTENSRAVIKPNGDVFVSMRATAKSSCPMDLRIYPFDTQECQLVLSSYSFTGNEIDLSWDKKPVTIDTVDGDIQVSSFVYKGTKTKKVEVKMGSNSEKFIVLKCIFKLQRSFTSTISRVYIPSSFLVVLTWATFFIPATAIPARITLIVTNFLATVFITQSTSSNIADVDYTTAVGMYLLANVVFITLTLVVLLLVLNIPNRDIKIFNIRKKTDAKTRNEDYEENGRELKQLRNANEEKGGDEMKTKDMKAKTHYLDNCAKIFVPTSYSLFIIIYFLYYYLKREK